MQVIKKIEIITHTLAMREVSAALEAHGVSSYTIIRDVIGKGERGSQFGDELSDVFKNSYLLTACLPEKVSEITEAIRPILKKCGGLCLVSDGQWVIH